MKQKNQANYRGREFESRMGYKYFSAFTHIVDLHLQQGLWEPELYGNLEYKFKKM